MKSKAEEGKHLFYLSQLMQSYPFVVHSQLTCDIVDSVLF